MIIRIQGEAPAETADPENVQNLTANWPSRGSVEFKNYFVKYRPNLPHVIDNLNVSINSGEKVNFNGVRFKLNNGNRSVLWAEQDQANQPSSYPSLELLSQLMAQYLLMALIFRKSGLMISETRLRSFLKI